MTETLVDSSLAYRFLRSGAMIKIDHIAGTATEPAIAEALHELEHHNAVEYVTLSTADTQRHRLRVMTDRGTECAIAVPRTQRLENGTVLLLEPGRAIVVRMSEVPWLTLRARDAAAALELGYFAGNMHWKVEFEGYLLRIALQGPVETYLERLSHLMQDGRITRAELETR
jgi:urease accessory protein